MKKYLNLIVVGASLLLFFIAWSSVRSVPTPKAVITSFLDYIIKPDFIDDLMTSIILTCKAMFFSIIVAMIISYGYLMPVINYQGQKVYLLRPAVEFITKVRYLPLTGIIFIFTQFSKDLASLKIMLLMFGIIPFFVTSMVGVIKSINPQYYDMCKTLKFNDWQTLWEIVIVGKADMAIEVIRQNFAISWLMITMIEALDMSGGGIGTAIVKSNRVMHLADIFAVQFTILLIGIGFDFGLRKLRYIMFPYIKLETK